MKTLQSANRTQRTVATSRLTDVSIFAFYYLPPVDSSLQQSSQK